MVMAVLWWRKLCYGKGSSVMVRRRKQCYGRESSVMVEEGGGMAVLLNVAVMVDEAVLWWRKQFYGKGSIVMMEEAVLW